MMQSGRSSDQPNSRTEGMSGHEDAASDLKCSADTTAESLAREVLELAERAGKVVATAESCTGGLLATLLTDVPGVLDRQGKLTKELTVAQVEELIGDGTISGGMIPKVQTCVEALSQGVEGVVIVNGKTPHAVLLELFTDHGAGTRIRRG